MSSSQNSSYDRRKHTQRKGQITTIVACSFILVAVIAILVVVLSVIRNSSANQEAEPTTPATVQPTLYLPTEPESDSPSEDSTNPTQPTEPATVAPTEKPTEPPTEKPTQAPPSPQALEGALHYYAYGSTSTGYDWTYSSYGEVVSITCKYIFDQGMYDFIITGTDPGTTDFTLIYWIGDNDFVSVPMSVTVDEDLKVTRIE